MIKTTLYIGLNDKDTKTQLMDKKYVISRLDYYFNAYTLIEANGRYKYSDGDIFNELTLIVVITGYDKQQIRTICKELKAELNQECIMVETQALDVDFM